MYDLPKNYNFKPCNNLQEPTPVLMDTNWEWVVVKAKRVLKETNVYGYTVDLFCGLKGTYSCTHK